MREAVEGNRPRRLLLVEDDATLASGLAQALGQSGYDVDRADTGREALRLARAVPYTACVLDLGLPDKDGLDVLRAMRSEAISCPVLVLTARDAIDDRIAGLDAGADDYLVKPFELGELEARLRALLRRRSAEGTPWRQLGHLRLDAGSGRAFAGEREIDLTKSEIALLDALLRRPGRIVAKESLYESLFPSQGDAGLNAVEVHVSRLRRKIEPAGVTIRALRGLGYRLEEAVAGADEARKP